MTKCNECGKENAHRTDADYVCGACISNLVEYISKPPAPVTPTPPSPTPPTTTPPTTTQLLDQSEAWLSVWDLCKHLGMSTTGTATGQERVLNFIKSQYQTTSQEYSFIKKVRKVLDKNYFLTSRSLDDVLRQITYLAEKYSQKPAPPTPGPTPTPTHPTPSKAATDKVGTGLTLIPWYSILAIGAIFIEGLRYGRDNWKKGVNDKPYQEERLEHAMLHLLKWKEGDRSEAHLAKVAWFCVTQLELERLQNETP